MPGNPSADAILERLASAIAGGGRPRLASQDYLCWYLGDISPSTLYRWIEAGRVPPAQPGARVWDLRLVDRYLDRWSGLPPADAATAVDGDDGNQVLRRLRGQG